MASDSRFSEIAFKRISQDSLDLNDKLNSLFVDCINEFSLNECIDLGGNSSDKFLAIADAT